MQFPAKSTDGTNYLKMQVASRLFSRLMHFSIWLFTGLFCLLYLSGLAQQEFRFEHISVDQGLSQSSINSITQDQYGFLWLATTDGLNQYDGFTFKVYKKKEGDPTSIFNNRIFFVFLDRSSNVWAGTVGNISRYVSQRDNFINYPLAVGSTSYPEAHVLHIFQLDMNTLILSTTQGLFQFNIPSGKYSVPDHAKSFLNKDIHDFYHSEKSGSWLFASDLHLYHKSENQGWEKINIPALLGIYYENNEDALYLRTENSLLLFNSSKNAFDTLDRFPVQSALFNPVLKLSSGDLWLGGVGIQIHGADGKRKNNLVYSAEVPTSLSGNTISSLYETRDGIIWVGTGGFGLNKYDPQTARFGYIGVFPGAPLTLKGPYVDAIYTEDDNLLLVSTTEGLDVIDIGERKTTHLNFPENIKAKNRANCFVKNPNNQLYIGTYAGVYTYTNGVLKKTGIPLLDSSYVEAMHFINPNKLILSDFYGVYLIEGRQVKKLSDESEARILVDNDTLWIGNPNKSNIQLIRISTGKLLKEFVHEPNAPGSAPAGGVKCFFKDSRNTIWIGSLGGGLSGFNRLTNSFIHYTEKEGLPNSVVYGILEDDKDNLWFSTNKGVCEFNLNTRHIRTFDVDDGLQSNEFNRRAYFKSAAGIMYFGGINGLSFFNPDRIETKSYVPQSVVTGFYINNQLIEEYAGHVVFDSARSISVLTLGADERDFGFDIAGLGFAVPGRTKYQYMLENYDNTWHQIGSMRHINFTNIPSGHYIFRIKSSNSYGQWEDKGARVEVYIETPFWRNALFLSLAIPALAILIFGSYYIRLYRLNKRAHELEKTVEERTREIQNQKEEIATQNEDLIRTKELLEIRVDERTKDLQTLNSDLVSQNSKLEQFAFITAHNIRGPVARIKGLLTLLGTDRTSEDLLSHLIKSVEDLDTVITDLTAILNIRNGVERNVERLDIRAILYEVIQLLDDSVQKENVTIDTSHFTPLLMKGVKIYFNSIFYNLLHNAIKYSSHERKPLITCTCAIVDDSVIITLSDNGIGIDMRYAQDKIFNLYQRFHTEINGKGFGLFLVKTQVEAMGGTISVSSEMNVGTEFKIIFPAV